MVALDKLNHKYGDHTVFYAAAGMNEKLKMMRRFKSPHYTTQWNELPVAI